MIEVFRTDISNRNQALIMGKALKRIFGFEKVSFDLGDCDKILRIEAELIIPHKVVSELRARNIYCETLPD